MGETQHFLLWKGSKCSLSGTRNHLCSPFSAPWGGRRELGRIEALAAQPSAGCRRFPGDGDEAGYFPGHDLGPSASSGYLLQSPKDANGRKGKREVFSSKRAPEEYIGPIPGNGQLNGWLWPSESLGYFLVCRAQFELAIAAGLRKKWSESRLFSILSTGVRPGNEEREGGDQVKCWIFLS